MSRAQVDVPAQLAGAPGGAPFPGIVVYKRQATGLQFGPPSHSKMLDPIIVFRLWKYVDTRRSFSTEVNDMDVVTPLCLQQATIWYI